MSIFEMQAAAVRSGKILLLPMAASRPRTLASFLSYQVGLCSFEEACPNVLQPTIKILLFFQSYPVFQLFSRKNTESILSQPPQVHTCTRFSSSFAGSRNWRNVL